MLDLSIIWRFLKDRFRLVDLWVRMWFAWDFEKTTLPVPVFLKRFAAALFVFILGILYHLLCHKCPCAHKCRWREQYLGSAHATIRALNNSAGYPPNHRESLIFSQYSE